MLPGAIQSGFVETLYRGKDGEFGWATVNGSRFENQDRCSIIPRISNSLGASKAFICVCDGHGGRKTADKFYIHVPKMIEEHFSQPSASASASASASSSDRYPSFKRPTKISRVDPLASTPPTDHFGVGVGDDFSCDVDFVGPTTDEEEILTQLPWSCFEYDRQIVKDPSVSGMLFDQTNSPFKVIDSPTDRSLRDTIIHFDWTTILSRPSVGEGPSSSSSSSSSGRSKGDAKGDSKGTGNGGEDVRDGAVAAMCILDRDRSILTAVGVGDCVILVIRSGCCAGGSRSSCEEKDVGGVKRRKLDDRSIVPGPYSCCRLTRAHRATNTKEAHRITKAGLKIESGRVRCGAIGMEPSRAFGDSPFKNAISLPPSEQAVCAVPDVITITVHVGDLIIVSSDGWYDWPMSLAQSDYDAKKARQVLDAIDRAHGDLGLASRLLCLDATGSLGADNTTVAIHRHQPLNTQFISSSSTYQLVDREQLSIPQIRDALLRDAALHNVRESLVLDHIQANK